MSNLEQYERIARKLGELHKNMKQLQGKMLEKYDISLIEYHILMLLWKNESLNQNDLVQNLNVDKALISRQVQNMEKKELVVTAVDPDCRRKKVLLLSNKSKELIPNLELAHREGLETIFGDISSDKLSDFELIIEGLVKKL